jgi:hypothetical protein
MQQTADDLLDIFKSLTNYLLCIQLRFRNITHG